MQKQNNKENLISSNLKIKSLKLNFILNSIRLSLNFLVPLIIFPYVSRLLGPEYFGKVEFANSIISYFILFSTLGIPVYGIREIARVRDDAEKRTKTLIELSIILIFNMLISYVVYFLLINLYPTLKKEKLLFLVISPSILLNDFSYEWFYQGIEDQTYITTRYIATKILQIILIFCFIHKEHDYIFYAGISVGLNSFSTLFNIIRLKKYVTKVSSLKNINLFQHLKPVLLIFTAQIAVSIYTHLDVTMIGLICTDEDVGIYSTANRIVRLVVMIVTSLSSVIIPRIEHCLKTNDIENYNHYLQISLSFIIMMALPCIAGIELLAPDIILVFAGNKYISSIKAIRILAPVILIIGFSNFVGMQVLYPHRKEHIYTIAVTLAAAINFISNFILIKKIGLTGAIIGTLIAETSGLLFMTILGAKTLKKIKISIGVWKYITATLIMTMLIVFLTHILKTWNPVAIILIEVTAAACIYFFLLLLFREKLIIEFIAKRRH